MNIVVDNNNSMSAYINVAGVKQDTNVSEANELINSFIASFNAGELSVTAFKNKDGRIIIGFK